MDGQTDGGRDRQKDIGRERWMDGRYGQTGHQGGVRTRERRETTGSDKLRGKGGFRGEATYSRQKKRGGEGKRERGGEGERRKGGWREGVRRRGKKDSTINREKGKKERLMQRSETLWH